jgi:hypothetical protein
MNLKQRAEATFSAQSNQEENQESMTQETRDNSDLLSKCSTQEHLDELNLKFGTSYQMRDFSGR